MISDMIKMPNALHTAGKQTPPVSTRLREAERGTTSHDSFNLMKGLLNREQGNTALRVIKQLWISVSHSLRTSVVLQV